MFYCTAHMEDHVHAGANDYNCVYYQVYTSTLYYVYWPARCFNWINEVRMFMSHARPNAPLGASRRLINSKSLVLHPTYLPAPLAATRPSLHLHHLNSCESLSLSLFSPRLRPDLRRTTRKLPRLNYTPPCSTRR